MDILKINALICGKLNHTELECKNPFNCINCTGENPAYSQEREMWKKESQKYTRNISFPETRKIVEQTQEQLSYAYVTKNRNEEMEDTKSKQEELNKLINEFKNLIEILKMITKETVKNTF